MNFSTGQLDLISSGGDMFIRVDSYVSRVNYCYLIELWISQVHFYGDEESFICQICALNQAVR